MPRFFSRPNGAVLMLLLGLAAARPVLADSLNQPPAPVIGSRNVATADLLVSQPTTTPCTVTLFSQQEFADFDAKPFSYTPPAACPGPWSKVVFEGDFSVTAGVQYDRTAQIFIGNVNVFYGTTAEPQSNVSPSWHVERDLTDYSALLASSQSGFASIGNIVNSTYTGIIYGTASLVFYPADPANPAPSTPDVVIPINAGGATTLSTTSSQMAQTLTLPTNIENAWLDVIAQSQSGDEFWYTCVPDDLSDELQSCGGTAFREVEVSIDGQPAGVAPVYPWIYTGGLNPRLWVPTPGAQTLNFDPYRVDLSPFAAMLSNGAAHTVALSVYGANGYFLATGTLMLKLDAGSSQISGALTSDTIGGAPDPIVKENIKSAGAKTSGTVSVSASRSFTLAGYVDTSHGRVTTSIAQTIGFSNQQTFDITATSYSQDIQQASAVTTTTTVTDSSGTSTTTRKLSLPLTINYMPTDSSIQQQFVDLRSQQLADGSTRSSKRSNTVAPSATVAQYGSSQHYVYTDSSGACYDRTISSTQGYVSGVTDRCTH